MYNNLYKSTSLAIVTTQPLAYIRKCRTGLGVLFFPCGCTPS